MRPSNWRALQREGLIAHLGTTNFDTDHLRVLVKHGIPILTNQVSFSLLDRRAAGPMSRFCLEHGVKLLAYGTLAGGLLSERWLGVPEPAQGDIADWSKSKYKRFVDAIGGWAPFQAILGAADQVAKRHGVSIANVATRWVLDHPAVAAVIVGARLGENEHRADNLRSFGFDLDDADHALIDAALAQATPIPGDCGDEYRRPPFLTASGDLSHHLAAIPTYFQAQPVEGRPGRLRVEFEERLGADRRLFAGRSRGRSRPGQRHHRDAWQRRDRLPGRSGRADDLYSRQDRREPRRARRHTGRRGPHPHLSDRMRMTGSRCRAPMAGRSARSGPPIPWSRSAAWSAITWSRSKPKPCSTRRLRVRRETDPRPAQAACLARATIWVGLTKRSAMTSQINVVTV